MWQADDFRYIHRRIGLTHLRETSFEEAGDSLFRGDTDPRLLIRLFPEFHRPRLTDDFTLDAFAGLELQVRALLNTTISEIG
jgi:vacuolar protein sorting-associated protein 3